jgi:hypothetical protein
MFKRWLRRFLLVAGTRRVIILDQNPTWEDHPALKDAPGTVRKRTPKALGEVGDTTESVITTMMWAKGAQERISEIVTNIVVA